VREFLAETARRADAELERLIAPPEGGDGGVTSAMRYALLAPGKRFRPALVIAAADLYAVPAPTALPVACAVEMVHACSLILDDLPSMDDADLRRGRPACHREYGEATAILAAFALLNRAYGVLAEVPGATDPTRSGLARVLSGALGTGGLIAGQALDLATPSRSADLGRLESIHRRKTGSLFLACVEAGALLGHGPEEDRRALEGFARNLGLAYQIVDDLIDATGTAAAAGKPVGSDRRGNFVQLAGVDGARRLAGELTRCAVDHLAGFGARGSLLAGLAAVLTERDR
jgi:farnesyl diphosphate synthase